MQHGCSHAIDWFDVVIVVCVLSRARTLPVGQDESSSLALDRVDRRHGDLRTPPGTRLNADSCSDARSQTSRWLTDAVFLFKSCHSGDKPGYPDFMSSIKATSISVGAVWKLPARSLQLQTHIIYQALARRYAHCVSLWRCQVEVFIPRIRVKTVHANKRIAQASMHTTVFSTSATRTPHPSRCLPNRESLHLRPRHVKAASS